MSFFQKLSETAKSTASTLGSKSAELMSTGKLKMEKMSLEGKVKDKKLELGAAVYYAFSAGEEPDQEAITAICEEIKELENQIAQIEQQMKVEAAKAETAPGPGVTCPGCGSNEKPDAAFCSKCGYKLAAKDCKNCGQKVAPGAKFCAGCGTPTE